MPSRMRGFQRFLGTIDRKERFLAAYDQVRTVAGAAELSVIHRATVYRWVARDPEFITEMAQAWRTGHQKWISEVYQPEQAARRAAKERRNAELRPMRQEAARRMRHDR